MSNKQIDSMMKEIIEYSSRLGLNQLYTWNTTDYSESRKNSVEEYKSNFREIVRKHIGESTNV